MPRHTLALLLTLTFAVAACATPDPRPDGAAATTHALTPVNARIGDAGFEHLYGHAPDASTPEALRIRAHLAYVERRLRAAPLDGLSAERAARRLESLDHLHDYWRAGDFPRNLHTAHRAPVFIDDAGTLCAVGHLFAATEGRAAAEHVNARHRFDAIHDMTDMPLLLAWADARGFTLDELAMIQPSYRPHPTPPIPPPVAPRPIKPPPLPDTGPTPHEVAAIVKDARGHLGACFSDDARPSSLRAILTLDPKGRVSRAALDYAGDSDALACLQDVLLGLRFPSSPEPEAKYRVDVRLPSATPVEPSPELALGTLRFESETPRQVFIGGVLIGETPTRAQVQLGTYTVELIAADGDTLTRTVHVDTAGSSVVLRLP